MSTLVFLSYLCNVDKRQRVLENKQIKETLPIRNEQNLFHRKLSPFYLRTSNLEKREEQDVLTKQAPHHSDDSPPLQKGKQVVLLYAVNIERTIKRKKIIASQF